MKYNRFNNKKYLPSLTQEQKVLYRSYYGNYPVHKVYSREDFEKAILGHAFAIDMGWSKVPLKVYEKTLIANCQKRAIFDNILFDDRHKTLGGIN